VLPHNEIYQKPITTVIEIKFSRNRIFPALVITIFAAITVQPALANISVVHGQSSYNKPEKFQISLKGHEELQLTPEQVLELHRITVECTENKRDDSTEQERLAITRECFRRITPILTPHQQQLMRKQINSDPRTRKILGM
jgi:hypothetical protein